MLKALPLGIEFFKTMRENDYYYADKTMMIRELSGKRGSTNLFTRPRRFGKTLTLNMLKTFYEQEIDVQGNVVDNRYYFDGLKIMDAGEKYLDGMGRYPVIWMTMKSAKQPDFDAAYHFIKNEIISEYERHSYVLNSEMLTSAQKDTYQKILTGTAETSNYAGALKLLSECLCLYHGRKTIILIDEYDVPLENAYFCGFYEQMVSFIRSLMESALKTNESLEFAVITGCLRISKESIFTGLNNLNVVSILNDDFAEYFGFVQSEVEELLCHYGLEGRMEEVKQWYDGYLFGQTKVYNPWSMINYVNGIVNAKIPYPRPYWANTSSNNIVKEVIERADRSAQGEIEGLMNGGTITKPIHEDITYADIYKSQDNLWNFLFFTGYLRAEQMHFDGSSIQLTMSMPNREIRYIYQNNVLEWFRRKVKTVDFTKLYETILSGDAEGFEKAINRQLKGGISYYDVGEAFYHGFMLGILGGMKDYAISSNREAGDGRADLVLKPLYEEDVSVIMEFKYVKNIRELDTGCDAALRQIEEKNYMDALTEDGYCNILKYGICFYKKTCKVKSRWDKLDLTKQ